MNRPHPPKQSAKSAAPLETLEQRVLLAGNAFFTVAPPYIAPTSTDIADTKNGPMANADQNLIDLYRNYRKAQRAGGSDATFKTDLSKMIMMVGTKVGVSVRGRGTMTELTQRLKDVGAHFIFRNKTNNVIDAYVPISRLHELAIDPKIVTINPMLRPVTQQQGTANNQADFVQKAQQVRDLYGLDGSGVKVGVLSDSAGRVGRGIPGSVATGDLPQSGVDVIADNPFPNPESNPFLTPTDEGRGMLELIHDIAPKADLAFATADLGIQSFADYIRQLRNAGSDVIVDDLAFPQESFFQPSVVDRAIADVVREGAVYLSSAANYADGGYEAPTNFVRIGRDLFVDFDPGPRVDTRLRVSFGGGTIVAQWDNPYDGVVGTATSDLDLDFFSTRYPDTVLGSLDTNNIKSGLPIEIGSGGGTYDLVIKVANNVPGAPLPTRFKLLFSGGLVSENPENQRAAFGHNNGEHTIAVGAVPFFAPANNEDFSSVGPVTRVFDINGNRLPSLVTLQKPDISGIDGVNTSFFPVGTFNDIDQDPDRLPNFFGTSAAAPDVAAVVALIRQADPTAPADLIAQVFRDTAIPLNGASAGDWDPKGGFGLIDAVSAAAFFVRGPIGDIKDVTPDPTVQVVDTLRITFTQVVHGLSIDDLTLSRDGGTNLLSGAQRLSTIDNGRTYILRDLASLTGEPGTYTLRIRAAGSGIVNNINLPLENDIVETWTKLIEQPIPTRPSDVAGQVLSSTTVRITWDDNSNNEDGFIIQRADDPDFTVNVKNFAVGANRVAFTDHVPVPSGKHFFYRVRAFNDFSGPSTFTPPVDVFAPTVGEVVLSIGSARGIALTGSWDDDEGPSISDGNSGKGSKSVRFTPALQFTDDYFVYAKWVGGSDRATNVPFDIFFGDGGTDRQTVIVNERARSGGYVLLGKFRMEKGTNAGVRVRNFGTDGVVNIQSVRFLPANGND